jgi:mono/diheme cytochrome c family protein
MAVLAFVLAFVLVGVAVVVMGFMGGPQGARRLKPTTRRGRRGITLLFVLAILLFGITVPAAVIATDKSRDSIPEAGVKNLTEVQQRGRELFAQRCKNCHTLAAANATARVGPNLDGLRPPKALVLDAIKNGRANGNGQMAAGLYTGKDADDVASYVAKAVGQTKPSGGG